MRKKRALHFQTAPLLLTCRFVYVDAVPKRRSRNSAFSPRKITAKVKECKVKNRKAINGRQDEKMSTSWSETRSHLWVCWKRNKQNSIIRLPIAIRCVASYKKGGRTSVMRYLRILNEILSIMGLSGFPSVEKLKCIKPNLASCNKD